MIRAAFLDRDGVINRRPAEGEYVIRWEDLHLLPDVAQAIALLNRAGFHVIVVTNQRCVAKRMLTAEALESMHRRMCDALASEGARVDAVYYCPHELQASCGCRKPSPGMLLAAARAFDLDLKASWMVGDSDIDVEAGRNAGCKTTRISSFGEKSCQTADLTALSLLDAARQIIARENLPVRAADRKERARRAGESS